jgi:ketosteroid isomerase-like protein
MAQKNMQLVQVAIDAFFRGDEPAMLRVAAPDVVIAQPPDQPDRQDYHGHEGMRQMLTAWIGSWDDWSLEILSTREVRDLVLATAQQRGRGKASGASFDAEIAFVFTVRDEQIVLWQMFLSEQQALEAAGLTE